MITWICIAPPWTLLLACPDKQIYVICVKLLLGQSNLYFFYFLLSNFMKSNGICMNMIVSSYDIVLSSYFISQIMSYNFIFPHDKNYLCSISSIPTISIQLVYQPPNISSVNEAGNASPINLALLAFSYFSYILDSS